MMPQPLVSAFVQQLPVSALDRQQTKNQRVNRDRLVKRSVRQKGGTLSDQKAHELAALKYYVSDA